MAGHAYVVADQVRVVFGNPPDSVEAIQEISFEVAQGEFVSILGPSGCGKSTLLSLIAGILQPTQGQVYIDGQTVRRPRRETVMVFQTPVLFPWRTVLKNVLFPIEVLRLKTDEFLPKALTLLRMTDLEDFKDRLPEQLSGGMKQRVTLCRALISDPELLLMDEPFSALDILTREDMNLELAAHLGKVQEVRPVRHPQHPGVGVPFGPGPAVDAPGPGVCYASFKSICLDPGRLRCRRHREFNRVCAEIRQVMGR